MDLNRVVRKRSIFRYFHGERMMTKRNNAVPEDKGSPEVAEKESVVDQPEPQNGAEHAANSHPVGKLIAAFDEIAAEVEDCNSKIREQETRRARLQKSAQDVIEKARKLFGVTLPKLAVEKGRPKRRQASGKQTITKMIVSYIEKNGQARASEIRRHLLSHGKKTGPGPALNRLTKEGVIRNVARGLYAKV